MLYMVLSSSSSSSLNEINLICIIRGRDKKWKDEVMNDAPN
jgi:hypothetical protein